MVQILIKRAMSIIQYLPKTKRIDRTYVDPLASVDYEDADDTWYFDESTLDEFYTVISREIPIQILQTKLIKNNPYQKTQLSSVGQP